MKKFLEVGCPRCEFTAAWLSAGLGKDSQNASMHYPFHAACGKCGTVLRVRYNKAHIAGFAAAAAGPILVCLISLQDLPRPAFVGAMLALLAAPLFYLTWAVFNIPMVVETESLPKKDQAPNEPVPVATLS